MNSILVLLSTYNGEAHLREQLDSILNQKDVNVDLLIRDDGSTDQTLDILSNYSRKHQNISYISGINVGVTSSFFKLFEMAKLSYDYYALSDQDDIWDLDKLSIASKALANVTTDLPSLYSSNCNLYYGDNRPLQKLDKANLTPDFRNALIENIARGASLVFNRELLLKIRIPVDDRIFMHDWWIYLVASCFGNVIYDFNPHYKYRQHDNNVIGASNKKAHIAKRRLKQSKSNKSHIYNQVNAFSSHYTIPDDKKLSADIILNYKTSFKYRLRGIFGKGLFRQRKLDNLIFRILFLTNHI